MNAKVVLFAIILLGWVGLPAGILAQNLNFAIIPFKLAGKSIYIEARAGGRPGNFIIDTGFQGILLNGRYYEGVKSDRVVYGINGQAQEVEVKYMELSLGEANLPGTYAAVGSLNNIEAQVPGITIMGLIGGNLFMDYELSFDFARGLLTLCRLDNKGRKIASPMPLPPPTDTFSLILKGHLPCIKVKVGKETLCFAVDSGAGANILHHKSLKKIPFYLKNQRAVQLVGLGQQPELATIGVLTGIELEGTPYMPMQTIVKNIGDFSKGLPGPDLDA